MSTERGGWTIEKDEIYEEFEIFSLKKSVRKNPRTGASVEFFRMDGLNWVNVIPLTENNEVVLVRQYRHGAEQFSLEIPGGCIDAGEDSAIAALRELREETGYEGKNPELLGVVHPNPAMMSMTCSYYLVRGVAKTAETELDEGEDIDVLVKPLEEVLGLIAEGEITHSLVVGAFGLFSLKGEI